MYWRLKGRVKERKKFDLNGFFSGVAALLADQGDNVVIKRYFAEINSVFSLKKTASLCKNLIITLVFR
jgi:hypothetical protein